MLYEVITEFQYSLTSYKKDKLTPENSLDGNYHSLYYRLYYHQILRQSNQDVFPDFGFIFDLSYRHSPNGTKGLGSITAGQGVLYLPGILANHGIKIYSGLQSKNKGEIFYFSNAINFPRGWGNADNNEMSSLAVDYKLPLIDPDLSLGVFYLKRITASLFADYANLKGTYRITSYNVCYTKLLRGKTLPDSDPDL